ncbi:prolyl oligopeptidase family serine peptidase [Blastomonas sp. SL216]|uniref:prolyl oligopeptidase family serine peptidase n=1 Tax=Blastomonas sp. SL216 TaxID=2995169 RepID=UPI002377273B|nr:prolyl oligopeptidase family serine peptidase [Blastomonas sp. SL216]
MTGKALAKRTQAAGWPILASLLLGGQLTEAKAETPERRWTLEDIVTAPKVTSLALSSDGSELAYIQRAGDIEKNQTMHFVYRVDLSTGERTEMARAGAATQLEAMKGERGWHVLLDIGEGQQLYRVDSGSKPQLVLASEASVMIGETEGGLFAVSFIAPHRVGVLAYDWSPDRKWLWYAALKPGFAKPKVQFDNEVVLQKQRRRAPVSAVVELRLRSASGEDVLVATRPASDRLAFYYAGTVSWADDGLRYYVETTSGTQSDRSEAFDLKFGSTTSIPAGEQQGLSSVDFMKGPRGGLLSTDGYGSELELVETRADGTRHSYGRYPYFLGHPMAAGSWRSADGRRTVLGMRTTTHPRYGLALVSSQGARSIVTQGSLTQCDFLENLDWGICVEESMTQPPRLVKVEPAKGKVSQIIPLSARHEAITPLRVTSHHWNNRSGHAATGFIVWPRDYDPGRRYPSILVTHGHDADERFADQDLQWEYPIQLWAERGYVVILANEPSPRQSPELMAAFAQWVSGTGPLSPIEVQSRAWLNVVETFEDVVSQLVLKGIVDSTRVGIAGYSRGSQITNVAITQSRAFKVASSGDGHFLEPAIYPISIRSYGAIFGGPPSGRFLENYLRISPSLRAGVVCAPVLQQVAGPHAGAIDFHVALRSTSVPAQISMYPGETTAAEETHLFHIPSNRLLAMRENLAWFDFWLLGKRDPDAAFSDRVDRWAAMADAFSKNCSVNADGNQDFAPPVR